MLAPVASAASGVQVAINGQAGTLLTAKELDGATDVDRNTQATVRDSNGREEKTGYGGVSLKTLVDLVGIDPASVRSLSVAKISTGGSVTVTGDEVRNGFPNGLQATVDVGSGSAIRFFRPQRTPTDPNGTDRIDTPSGRDLQIALETDGAVRTVTASVDDENPDPGQSVTFGADVAGAGGVSFTYRWNFDDGTVATGQRPSHDFPAGSYQVRVTAVGSDGSAGVGSVPVMAGSAAAAPTQTPPPEQGGTGAAPPGDVGTGGPAPTGGGTGGEDDRATGPADADGKAGEGTRGRERERPDAERKPRRDRERDAPDRPERSQDPEADATPAPDTFAGAPPASSSPTPTPTPEPDREKEGKAEREPGEPVDGDLLAGAGAVAQLPEPPDDPVAQERSRTRAGGGGGDTPLGWIAGGAGLVLLLAAGAARESGLRPRLLRA